jgi:hypothetical protein
MDFQRFGVSLKKRSSNNAVKQRPQISTPILQAPIVHTEKPPARSNRARVKPNVMFSNMDDLKDQKTTGDSALLPTSPTFDSEEETAVGEPLIQDFATSSIPKEYKPIPSRNPQRPDRESGDFSIQHAFPAIADEDEDRFLPNSSPRYDKQRFTKREVTRDAKRDTSIHVPTRTR